MIITRNEINKDIIFRDFDANGNHESYSFESLSKTIDLYKNFLVDNGAEPGKSVLIGYGPSKRQMALFFAVCELGMHIIVNDYKMLETGDFDFIDTKTKILLPIDYVFDYGDVEEFKRKYTAKISNRCVTLDEIDSYENFNSNDIVWATKDSLLLRCTSSGTTGTPKLVNHTHEFVYNMANRNSKDFFGEVGLAYNINHGSSLGSYFLPALLSEDVVFFSNFLESIMRDQNGEVVYSEIANSILSRFSHLMIPYPNQLSEMLSIFKLEKINYYTLGPITDELYNKREMCKDIISSFGSNEVGGPIFINKASFSNFRSNVYFKVDDCYELDSINPLIVNVKEYGTKVDTNDAFVECGDGYEFLGRTTILRINGLDIPKKYDDMLLEMRIEGEFIYDTMQHKIYLALWRDYETLVSMSSIVNEKLKNLSKGAHTISKVKVLQRDNFINGVKLDKELLRSYFRERVDSFDPV